MFLSLETIQLPYVYLTKLIKHLRRSILGGEVLVFFFCITNHYNDLYVDMPNGNASIVTMNVDIFCGWV